MKLVIVGNGFDIAHKLGTRYEKFRDYLKNMTLRNMIFLAFYLVMSFLVQIFGRILRKASLRLILKIFLLIWSAILNV